MNWSSVEVHWRELADKLRERWSKLAHHELPIRVEPEHLDAKLQQAYGLEGDQLRKNADDFCVSR